MAINLGLPSLDDYQTVDGIRFTVRAPSYGDASKFLTWDGGARGGCFDQYNSPLSPEYDYKNGITVYRTFDKAARASIRQQRLAYESALARVAAYESAK